MTAQEKYRVLNKLAAGGMAEVFVAEAESLQGFTKQVAIKRVLPHLAENRKFLAMFLDEARLSLRFNHGNVVQTFDIGRSGDTYFIVMEYVNGTDLKSLVKALKDRGQHLPTQLAVFVIQEACRGLHYAHTMIDPSGGSLNIVHRDVSPPNILLSKQGEVKIVDFGLAKATSQLEHTDPGVVKGKFAYLSPEVAYGKSADHKADQFACGIILWEMLTGSRLFLGENDYKTVELVRRAHVPAIPDLNPQVPRELDGLVRRALAFEPGDRFADCAEMAEALSSFLFEHRMKVNSFDLQRVVESVVSEQESQQPVKPSLIDQLIQEEMGRFASLDADDEVYSEATGRESYGSIPLDHASFTETGSWKSNSLTGSSEEVTAVSEPPMEPPSLAQMLEGEVRLEPISVAPDEQKSSGGAAWLVAAVVFAVLGGGALAAYLLGFFS
jgi:eukaryotic-like serine/threonine-protein kinase